MRIGVIGAGGTGGWVANLLAKMLKPEDVLVLIDRDKFERKNMDRQLNCRVGRFKVAALAEAINARCEVKPIAGWFGAGDDILPELDAVICCADNHRARLACLMYADRHDSCMAYIAGNGYESFDAYAYQSLWRDTAQDPRIYFPELLTDASGDPTAPPCTGAVLESSPQLALANMQAATAVCRLWYFWTFKVPEFDVADYEIRDTFEYKIIGSAGKLKAVRIGDA